MELSLKKYSKQLILSAYLTWYLYIVISNFDSCLQIWINALVISLVVGIALNASVKGDDQRVWQRLRLFIIPFAVSSYTGLIRGKDFWVILPPSWKEVAIGLICCLVTMVMYYFYLVRHNK